MRDLDDIIGANPDPPTRVPVSIERVLLAIAMGLMVVITLANVVTRYLSNISLAFTEEYSVVLLVVITLLGSSYAFVGGRHMRVEYFVGRARTKNQYRLALFSTVASLLLFLIILVYGSKMTWDTYRFEVLSSGLGNPEWIYLAFVPVISIGILCRLAGNLVRLLRSDENKS